MPEEDFHQIQIRCPKCSQRFRVGPELKGRMVECGACEFRFRVDDEAQVKNRKFYPGEKKDPTLNRYSRQPHREFAASSPVMEAHYSEAPDVERFEPTPIGKIIVGIAGGAVMAVTLLVLITGASQHGLLGGVTTDRRLVIAGFAAVVGAMMIIYANPRARGKATFFALLGALALVATPIFMTEGSKPLSGGNLPIAPVTPPTVTVDGRKKISDLKVEVGYAPMETALLQAGQGGRVVGLWLKGLRESNAEMVYAYLMRVSQASEQSHLYPRMNQNSLIVLINPKLSLEELALQSERIGEVNQTVPELHLIGVKVENERFAEQSQTKLSDKEDGAFYQLNLRELQGIDIRRINDALLRLALADPVQSRDDIIKRMIELLEMSDREMLANICKAMIGWSDGKDGAPEAAMKAAAALFKAEKDLPIESATFLAKWQQPGIYPILEQLWLQDPTSWEEVYMKSGALAEAGLIKHLTEGSNRLRMSAARIIGRVGGKSGAEALQSALESTKDLELQTSFSNAIDAIRQRQP
jgi:hypothetical protein